MWFILCSLLLLLSPCSARKCYSNHCADCTGDFYNCKRCEDGYDFLPDTTWKTCGIYNVPHCIKYYYRQGGCETCEAPLLPAEDTRSCNDCSAVPHCAVCNTTNQCTTCAKSKSYVLVDDEAGRQACVESRLGCLVYALDGRCVQCKALYSLQEDGSCTFCPVEHCTRCQRDYHCDACTEGRRPSPDGYECLPCQGGQCAATTLRGNRWLFLLAACVLGVVLVCGRWRRHGGKG